MSDFQLLIDFFAPLSRLGPGDTQSTLRALHHTGLSPQSNLQVADLGCGTGASTLALTRALPRAQVTAVDLLPELLAGLSRRAHTAGLTDRITPLPASMDALPLAPASLDLIWCEAAIYSMGFRAGARTWRPLLRPGGVLVVSEVVWTTPERPAELEAFWTDEYAEMGHRADKLAVLEAEGYHVLHTFDLPRTAWLNDYYAPVQARFVSFLQEQRDSPEARALVAALQHEADLYAAHSEHVAYTFFVARRP